MNIPSHCTLSVVAGSVQNLLLDLGTLEETGEVAPAMPMHNISESLRIVSGD
jgi:hypothetical protein